MDAGIQRGVIAISRRNNTAHLGTADLSMIGKNIGVASPFIRPILAVAVISLIAFTASLADATKSGSARTKPPSYDAKAVNDPNSHEDVKSESKGSTVVRLQILLDRAHFSPGEIDGQYGDNLRAALEGYQAEHNLAVTGISDADTWRSLNTETSPALVLYTIAPADVAGPFEQSPTRHDGASQAEILGLSIPGREIGGALSHQPPLVGETQSRKESGDRRRTDLVPNVRREPPRPAVKVVVTKSHRTVYAYASDATLLAQYPATIGSEHDPLPIGDWKITRSTTESRIQLQPRPVLGRQAGAFQSANPPGTEQPSRRGVDHLVERALRNPRHTGAESGGTHRIPRLHPPNQLGRGRAVEDRKARTASDPAGVN